MSTDSVKLATQIGSAGVPAEVKSLPSAESGKNALDDNESVASTRDILLGATAVGYYLSLGVHILAYLAAAAAFFFISSAWTDAETETVAVRARLDDRDQLDDNPFEEAPEINLTSVDIPSKASQMSTTLKAVEEGLIETLTLDELPEFGSAEAEGEDPGGNFLFKLPEAGLAVTKGSFTAWTVPQEPAPLQPYKIIIEIRLPDSVKKYRVTDLSGKVKGTDEYEQSIPYDARTRFGSAYTDENNQLRVMTGRDVIPVRKNKIQLVITVPGARRLVRDVIEIRSRRLREKQTIELEFGG